MKTAIAPLAVLTGLVAGAAPLWVVSSRIDAFAIGLAVLGFVPFGVLAGIHRLMSLPALLITLVALGGVQALAVSEFLGSSDGQAGLIFFFLPFYMGLAVLIAWGLDALVRLSARRLRGRAT